jgi:nucleoside 2-deoxyribosyltransferase
MSAVAAADLVVAYITATDCHGTLFEIGYALALGKPVVMVFAPNIDAADFWFLSMQCAAVYESVDLCRLSEILAAEIRKTIRRRRTT